MYQKQHIMIRGTLTLVFLALMFIGCDECRDVDCGANGSCDEGDCICDAGYEGSSCETEERAKFIGNWSGPSLCAGEVGSANVVVSPGTDVTKVTFFPAEDTSLNIEGIIDGSTMTVANVSATNSEGITFNVSGNGTINAAGTMDLELLFLVDGYLPTDCSYTLSK